jgi:hypothetical protein
MNSSSMSKLPWKNITLHELSAIGEVLLAAFFPLRENLTTVGKRLLKEE